MNYLLCLECSKCRNFWSQSFALLYPHREDQIVKLQYRRYLWSKVLRRFLGFGYFQRFLFQFCTIFECLEPNLAYFLAFGLHLSSIWFMQDVARHTIHHLYRNRPALALWSFSPFLRCTECFKMFRSSVFHQNLRAHSWLWARSNSIVQERLSYP